MRPLTLRTVLVATDLDRSSETALDSARRLATAAGAALHVVHVIAPAHAGVAGSQPRGDSDALLGAALRRGGVREGDAKIHLIPGSPADTIRSLADRVGADVIVLGPHRERDARTGDHPLGGTAHGVGARAFAPCLIAPRPLRLPLERVLVPIDLSETARGALLVGLSWASALRAGAASRGKTALTVLHVDSGHDAAGSASTPTSVDAELEMLRHDAGDWAGVTVRGITTRSTDVTQTIADYSGDQKADLVVLGTRGLGLDDVARLGSVSTSVTTRLEAPILLVPPAVWRAHAALP